jgi:hypothetical protein
MTQLVRIGRLMTPSRLSSVMAPPGWVMSGASLDIDFANNRAWGLGIGPVTPAALLTVTRATVGFARSSAGAFSSFAADTLRRSDLGANLENTNTNIVQLNTNPSDASWVKTSATLTTGNSSPDGGTTAFTFADTPGVSSHNIQSPAFAFVSGTTYCASIIATLATGSLLQLTFPSVQFSGVGYANFNVSTGVVTATGGTLVASGIDALGGGYYRCWIAATATASSSGSGIIICRINSTTATRALSYNGVNQTIKGWLPQTEVGSYPSSPILNTTAGSLQRDADNVTVSSAAAQSLIFAAKSCFTDTQNTNFLTAGVVANIDTALLQASTNTAMQISNGSDTATATLGSGTFSANEVKAAFSFDGVDLTAIANAGSLATTAATWSGTSGTINLGNRAALDRAIRGYLKRIAWSASASNFDAVTA